MKKVSILLILILLAACSTKTTNIMNVKVEKNIYEEISQDTIDLIKNNINIDSSSIIINGKLDQYLNILEQKLRIAGYPVFVTAENVMLKENDYLLKYIIDTIEKTKIKKNTVLTVRYTLSIKDKSCSKIYEINNKKEILFKSEWYCLGD